MDYMFAKNRRQIVLGAAAVGLLLLSIVAAICLAAYVVRASSSNPSCELWNSEPARESWSSSLKNYTSSDLRAVANFYAHLQLTQRNEPNARTIERKYLPLSLRRELRYFKTPDLNYRLLLGAECGLIEFQLMRNTVDQRQSLNYGIVYTQNGTELCYFRPVRIETRGLKRHYRCTKDDTYNCKLFDGAAAWWSSALIVIHQFEFELNVDQPLPLAHNGGTAFSTIADDCM